MNPLRAHGGFSLEDALSGAYAALGERDPEDVKFSVWHTLDGETTMTGEDGQVATWRQKRDEGGFWCDEGEIVFTGIRSTAFVDCANRVRLRNG
jgi:hypothetical protein